MQCHFCQLNGKSDIATLTDDNKQLLFKYQTSKKIKKKNQEKKKKSLPTDPIFLATKGNHQYFSVWP